MEKNATLGQRLKVDGLVRQKEVSSYRLQLLLSQGLISDLLDSDTMCLERNDFRRFLGLLPIEGPEVWQTIKLGVHKSAKELREAILTCGFEIGSWADVIDEPAFTIASEETEINLTTVSVAGLGFREGAMFKDIYKKATEFGLRLCPAEVGPELRLQYKDQPKGDCLVIAMSPLGKFFPMVFEVQHPRNYGMRFDAGHGGPNDFRHGFWRFVFSMP